MKKRLLSLLLALVFAVSLIPMALAAPKVETLMHDEIIPVDEYSEVVLNVDLSLFADGDEELKVSSIAAEDLDLLPPGMGLSWTEDHMPMLKGKPTEAGYYEQTFTVGISNGGIAYYDLYLFVANPPTRAFQDLDLEINKDYPSIPMELGGKTGTIYQVNVVGGDPVPGSFVVGGNGSETANFGGTVNTPGTYYIEVQVLFNDGDQVLMTATLTAIDPSVEHFVTAENCFIITGEGESDYTEKTTRKPGDVVTVSFKVLDYFHKEDMSRRFDHWEVTPSYITIDEVGSAGGYGTFIMPDEDVTIVGVAKPIMNVTVEGGDCSGIPIAGDSVRITADDPPAGQVFDHWEVVSGGVTLDDPNSPETEFIVGNEDVTVKAVFIHEKDGFLSFSYDTMDKEPMVGSPIMISFQLNVEVARVDLEYLTEDRGWVKCKYLADDTKGDTVTYIPSEEKPGSTVTYRLAALTRSESISKPNEDGTIKNDPWIYTDTFTITFSKETSQYVVDSSSAAVYEEPSENSKGIGEIEGGHFVTVVETKGDWSKIVYEDRYGWVMSKYLTPKGETEKPNPFTDVSVSDPYYDAVLWAYYADPQITDGMTDTTFGPELTVTRGQCVTFLWRAMGKPEPSGGKNPFTDVPADQYYYKAVLWAVEKGITDGVTDTTFEPNTTLSTQHIITFLYRTLNPGKDGWSGEAAAWAGKDDGGKPFGVDIAVNNKTDCPRWCVVQFLYKTVK